MNSLAKKLRITIHLRLFNAAIDGRFKIQPAFKRRSVFDMSYPKMMKIRQKLYSSPIPDITGHIKQEMLKIRLSEIILPGERIAITAGSRGVANIAQILACLVKEVKAIGAEPFLIPTMGSHGGGIAEGQIDVLEGLGVTERSVGAPILSSMEVVQIGETPGGLPVYIDKNGAEADGIIVVGRVKQHTDFSGTWESGLLKMMVIGLGKKKQAEVIHALGVPGLRFHIPEVAKVVLDKADIRFGVAILEDGYDRTSEIIASLPEEIIDRERKLLQRVKRNAARLPFKDIDILIVDRLGKDISGAGMDTNVIGRLRIPGEREFRQPRIKIIVTLDLTEGTHGNAAGIGLADFTTKRLADKIDWDITNINTITSGFLERGKMPITFPSDKETIDNALFMIRSKPVEEVRLVRILDTLYLKKMHISEGLLETARNNKRIVYIGEPKPMQFDEEGNLLGGIRHID